MSTSPLIAHLPAGPLDIVGDVHGEIDALDALLDRLGQPGQGRPHLVFLGDLIDRGPDSIAVVERVAGLVAAGHATCLLGNHELNILRDRKRSGNRWFWGDSAEPWKHMGHDGTLREGVFASRTPSTDQQQTMRSFFSTLPVVAQRPDLRVVHAAWSDTAVAALATCANLTAGLARSDADADQVPETLVGAMAAERELLRSGGYSLTNPNLAPPAVPALAQAAALRQNTHHLSVLTSGPEEPRPGCPAWRAGRWRVIRRQRWWDHPVATPTIFGHYWRIRGPVRDASRYRLFDHTAATDWLGPDRRAFCLDFSVGRRYRSRTDAGEAPSSGFREALAALRWTDADTPSELWFDDETHPVRLPPPGVR